MKVGYFKVKPKVSALPAAPKNKLLSVRKLTALPATGLVLGMVLISGMQIGVKLSSVDLPRERYQSVAAVSLPENVSFLSSVYDWSADTWDSFTTNWRVFLGLESAPIVIPVSPTIETVSAELKEQIRQQVLSELKAEQASSTEMFGGVVVPNKPAYTVTVVPATGSATADEMLKQSLKQVFADKVDIKFDSSGTSGLVTPILQDGRRGSTYVFVLTPTR